MIQACAIMRGVKETELAWAAGFFDGEGCFSLHNKNYPYPNASVNQAGSPDLLVKFNKILNNKGNITGPHTKFSAYSGNKCKPQWDVCFNGFEKTQFLLAALWKFLGEVKRLDGIRVLENHKQYKSGEKERRKRIDTHCKKGHELNFENTYFRPDGKGRNCRICRVRRSREYNARKR